MSAQEGVDLVIRSQAMNVFESWFGTTARLTWQKRWDFEIAVAEGLISTDELTCLGPVKAMEKLGKNPGAQHDANTGLWPKYSCDIDVQSDHFVLRPAGPIRGPTCILERVFQHELPGDRLLSVGISEQLAGSKCMFDKLRGHDLQLEIAGRSFRCIAFKQETRNTSGDAKPCIARFFAERSCIHVRTETGQPLLSSFHRDAL